MPELTPGGVEVGMLRVMAGLIELGSQVEVVVVDGQGPLRHHLPVGATLIDLARPRMRQALLPLARHLRHTRPDVLIAAKDYCNVVAAAARALSRTSPVLLLTCHSALTAPQEGRPSLGKRLLPMAVRLTYRGADAIVAVSARVARDLVVLDRRLEKIVVEVSPPSIPGRLHAMAAEPTSHPWFDVPGPPVILGLGRLAAVKDFSTLIRAFAITSQTTPVRLLILGEGPKRDDLEALVLGHGLQESVQLPGALPNPYPFLARASVLAMSSVSEASPMVFIEALALGRPVVSTRCCDLTEALLADGRHGALVPVGDAEALAEALTRVILNPPASERVDGLDAFTQSAVAQRYLTIIDGVRDTRKVRA